MDKKTEAIITKFVDENKMIFGNDLVSVILFGSAAREEFNPKISDLNFLVVLKDNTPSSLVRCKNYIKKWRKNKISLPVFLTLDYIVFSQDTYPIEFFEMKAAYKVVFGLDVLEGLKLENNFLRLQLERELKSRLFHLRQQFLAGSDNAKFFNLLIKESFSSLMPLFRVLIFITTGFMQIKREEVLDMLAKQYKLDVTFLNQLAAIASKKYKPNKTEMINIFDKYIEEIEKIVNILDEIRVS